MISSAMRVSRSRLIFQSSAVAVVVLPLVLCLTVSLSGPVAGSPVQLVGSNDSHANAADFGSSSVAMLSDPLNEFAIQLLDQVSREAGDSNVFLSPVSVSTALSMLLLGARDSSETQLKQVLRVPAIEANQDNKTIHLLMHEFLEGKVDISDGLSLANLLMIRKEAANNDVQHKYKSEVQTLYHADVKDVDFVTQSDEAMTQANEWVKATTKGLIKKILDSAPEPDTRAIIMNTIYFDGKWQQPFLKSNNQKCVFWNNGVNQKEDIDFMSQQNVQLPYKRLEVNNQSVQVIELAYVNDSLSLIIVLPDEKTGLQAILSPAATQSTGGNNNSSNNSLSDLKDLIASVRVLNQTQRVNLLMPKFKLEAKYNLKSSLEEMGVTDIFNSNVADLSGVNGQRNLFVSEVKHKTALRVDEEGTEAAAVTLVAMPGGSFNPEALDFRADHPFLFLLRERESGLIFFEGTLQHL